MGSNPTAVICAARSCVQYAESGWRASILAAARRVFLCWYSVSSLGSILRSEANSYWLISNSSATGARARVAWVRAEYPNQLDYSGAECNFTQILSRRMCSTSYHFRRALQDGWGHVRKRRRDAPEKNRRLATSFIVCPPGADFIVLCILRKFVLCAKKRNRAAAPRAAFSFLFSDQGCYYPRSIPDLAQ